MCVCVHTFVYPHALTQQALQQRCTCAERCVLNAACCSVSVTLASVTYPSPPECISSALLSAVHPRKQRHLIGVHSPAKSFILFLPLYLECVAWSEKNYNHYFFYFFLGGGSTTKQINRTSYPHTIHKIVCVHV